MKTSIVSFLFFIFVCCTFSCTKNNSNGQRQSHGCDTVTALQASYNSDSVALQWFDTSSLSYLVQYRPVGTTPWDSAVIMNTPSNQLFIGYHNLLLNPPLLSQAYEWRVQSTCSSGVSAFTSSHYFYPLTSTKLTYLGTIHSLKTSAFEFNTSGNNTSVWAYDNASNISIQIIQTGLATATANFACDPNLIQNALILNINGIPYINSTNSIGSETRTVLNDYTVSLTFNCTVYNSSNPSDSIVITSGSYVGGYYRY